MPTDGVFEMRGKEVWDQAIKVLPDSIKSVLNNSKTGLSEIKMLIPHQPSINILKLIAEDVGLPMSKVKTVMDRYGNIASSSIPIALDDAIKNGEVVKGDKIILTVVLFPSHDPTALSFLSQFIPSIDSAYPIL